MPPTLQRHFLGWNKPSLDLAAQWILDHHSQPSGTLDLDAIHLVVPGQRAARILLGNLVDLCTQQGIVLIPPYILTPLDLPAALLGVPGVHASKLSRRLAWIEALHACDSETLNAILPSPPESDQPDHSDHWIGLGQWIAGVSSELCDAGLRMNAVAEHAGEFLDESEQRRWTVLGHIQDQYERNLTGLGLIDDRLATLDRVLDATSPSSPTATAPQPVLLIGMPEIGSMALASIERAEAQVVSLVFAPEELADRFDAFGCVRTDQWTQAHVEIDESRILFEDTQANMCTQALTQLALRAQGDDGIVETSSGVLGLADETLIGTLRQHASMTGPHGITLHAPGGLNAEDTPPGRLLLLIQSHLQEHSFDTLAQLIRYPTIEQALSTKSLTTAPDDHRPSAWWLDAMDRIRQDHVLTSTTHIPQAAHDWIARDVRFVLDAIDDLLKPILDHLQSTAPLNQWALRLTQSLEHIYAEIELDPQSEHDHPTIQGLNSIRAVLDEINQAHELGQAMPETTAHGAIGLVLDRLSETRLAEPINRDAIETLGWLELMHDPSPVCVVLGMSESCVPGSVNHDPLLPGSLRNALDMPSNEDRLARDTYLMAAINASRDAVFMCARRGNQNDPITPSRLLLRTQGQDLARRIERFVESSADTPSPHALSHTLAIHAKAGPADLFHASLRVADGYVPPNSLRVTDFDAYLRSPAQWYLERHLNLDEIDTQTRELSPAHLGSLIHEILEAYGNDPAMRDLDQPKKIHDALLHLLDEESRSQFGTKPPAAVLVQTRLLHHRLQWFAEQQAERRREGWTIAHWEWSPEESSSPGILVDNEFMALRGKIDRIDIHPDGHMAIIDYKTGKITDARRAHQSKDEWIKLQLPLYRFLIQEIVQDQSVTLGYAGLPASEHESVWSFADWDQEELDQADEAARDVVRSIRNLSPGDEVPLGDCPPDAGILGFITGQRFEMGGHEPSDDPEDAAVEVGS